MLSWGYSNKIFREVLTHVYQAVISSYKSYAESNGQPLNGWQELAPIGEATWCPKRAAMTDVTM